MKKLDKWMIDTIGQARRMLGVGIEWHLFVEESDKPCGDSDNEGCCQPSSTYLNAKIEFQPGLHEKSYRRAVVYHEVGHVAHSPIDRVVNSIIQQVPEADRGYFSDLYRDVVETYIQRVSRGITDNLVTSEDEDDSDRPIHPI